MEKNLEEIQRMKVRELKMKKKVKIKAGRKIISQELKLEIPAEIRIAVENKCNSKCVVCKKRPGKLQIHHINLENSDNSLANLELLCQKHHAERHREKN
jgi:hypothetical protein